MKWQERAQNIKIDKWNIAFYLIRWRCLGRHKVCPWQPHRPIRPTVGNKPVSPRIQHQTTKMGDFTFGADHGHRGIKENHWQDCRNRQMILSPSLSVGTTWISHHSRIKHHKSRELERKEAKNKGIQSVKK